MALANDNCYGYALLIIYRWQVRWIEAAAACPCWTTLMVFYLEEDHGHLMQETMFQQQFKTGSRGNVMSFHMPWEDIIKNLLATEARTSLTASPEDQGLPHDPDVLAQMVRLHLHVAAKEECKHVKHAKLRPHVVLQLLHELVDRNHRCFRGKGTAEELKVAMREAVMRKYPEDPEQAALPEELRDGTVPPAVLEAMRQSWQKPKGQ